MLGKLSSSCIASLPSAMLGKLSSSCIASIPSMMSPKMVGYPYSSTDTSDMMMAPKRVGHPCSSRTTSGSRPFPMLLSPTCTSHPPFPLINFSGVIFLSILCDFVGVQSPRSTSFDGGNNGIDARSMGGLRGHGR